MSKDGKEVVISGVADMEFPGGRKRLVRCRVTMMVADGDKDPMLSDAERWAMLPKSRTYTQEVLEFIDEVVANGKSRAHAARLIREIEEALAARRAELE